MVGDQHNPNFGFITFFPAALHPGVTVLTTVRARLRKKRTWLSRELTTMGGCCVQACFRVAEQCPCCTTLHEQKRNVVNIMKHQALPGHTQSEAERYRQRALEMLDQKLAGGGSAAAGGAGGGGAPGQPYGDVGGAAAAGGGGGAAAAAVPAIPSNAV